MFAASHEAVLTGLSLAVTHIAHFFFEKQV